MGKYKRRIEEKGEGGRYKGKREGETEKPRELERPPPLALHRQLQTIPLPFPLPTKRIPAPRPSPPPPTSLTAITLPTRSTSIHSTHSTHSSIHTQLRPTTHRLNGPKRILRLGRPARPMRHEVAHALLFLPLPSTFVVISVESGMGVRMGHEPAPREPRLGLVPRAVEHGLRACVQRGERALEGGEGEWHRG